MADLKTPPRTGSIKNKIVAADLEEERKKCYFDQKEMTLLVWGGQTEYGKVRGFIEDMEAIPELRGTEKWYDMTREEQQENALMRLRKMYDVYNSKYFKNYTQSYVPWFALTFQGLVSIDTGFIL